jgi:protein gp37
MTHELTWPPNVWMGVSVEAPDHLYRVEDLRAVAVAVRFLSCEPLPARLGYPDLKGVDWVIAGGERGPAYRPVAAGWSAICATRASGNRCRSSSSSGAGSPPSRTAGCWTAGPGVRCRARH